MQPVVEEQFIGGEDLSGKPLLGHSGVRSHVQVGHILYDGLAELAQGWQCTWQNAPSMIQLNQEWGNQNELSLLEEEYDKALLARTYFDVKQKSQRRRTAHVLKQGSNTLIF